MYYYPKNAKNIITKTNLKRKGKGNTKENANDLRLAV